MALKAKISKDDHAKLADALKEHYVERDGAFVLEAEGLVASTALEGERAARAKAARDFQELKDKIGDLDPEAARKALKQVQELADRKLLDEGKVEELIKARTDAMRVDHENQINGFKKQITERDTTIGTLTGTLKKLRINSELMPLAVKKGVQPGALSDVISRMTITGEGLGGIKWDIDGDQVVAKVGDQIKYGKDPQKPMSFEEGLDLLAANPESKHLFAPNQGGGAGGGSRSSGSGGSRTISNDDASDPAKYRAARDEARKAGVELVVQ